MADMKATARIPCRPLSIVNKNLAEAKELLVDYEKGTISVCKADGTIVDVSESIKEVVIEQVTSDPNFSDSITIEVDGNTYTIETIINNQANYITELQEALGYYVDDSGKVQFDLLNKIATIDPDTGKVTFTITSNDIITSDDKQFISKAEKEDYAKATYPEIIRATIKGGESNWTGTEAPYTQQVTVADILEADVPVVDISLSDIYETAQKQLDSYAYIYRILTYDGSIVVYASKPTEDDVTIQMKVDR